jgi:hypothetical protein
MEEHHLADARNLKRAPFEPSKQKAPNVGAFIMLRSIANV